MMKRVCFVLLAATTAVSASPLVVWKSNRGEQSASVSHSSTDVKASDIIGEVLRNDPSDESSLAGVVFLLGRSKDGSESFSNLASQGVLPGVASKYDEADSLHHHVSGLDTAFTVVRLAGLANPKLHVVDVTLSEFSSKVAQLGETAAEIEVNVSGPITSKTAGKRARALSKANVLVVKIDGSTDPAEIDRAVVRAIEHKAIDNVILTGLRSHEEVKLERDMFNRRRLEMQKKAGEFLFGKQGSRRLAADDDANANAQGDDAANANANSNSNYSGVYYVNMTPNILAGILFFFMFCVVTWIAISCMNMIVGQDVYVSKMPTIGREA